MDTMGARRPRYRRHRVVGAGVSGGGVEVVFARRRAIGYDIDRSGGWEGDHVGIVFPRGRRRRRGRGCRGDTRSVSIGVRDRHGCICFGAGQREPGLVLGLAWLCGGLVLGVWE
jgi:hypothetical protein